MDKKTMLFIKRNDNNYIMEITPGQVFALDETLSDDVDDYYISLNAETRQSFVTDLVEDCTYVKDKKHTGVGAVLFSGGVCRDDYQDKD